MRRLPALLVLGAVSLGLLSCAAPFLERAIDPPGLSGGFGIEGIYDLASPDAPEGFGREYLAMPVGFVRYRAGRVTWCLRGGYGIGVKGDPNFDGGGYLWRPPEPVYEIEAALKVQVSGRSSLKLAIGTIGFTRSALAPEQCHLDLDYLHDFSPFFTGDIGIGVPRLLKLGVAIHPRLSRYLVSHVAIQGAAFSSLGIGLGLDVLPSAQE